MVNERWNIWAKSEKDKVEAENNLHEKVKGGLNLKKKGKPI